MDLKNSYYDIAYNDYLFLQKSLNTGFYNNTLPLMQQICEKLLKSVLIDFDLVNSDVDTLLRIHKLDRIYEGVKSRLNQPVPFELSVESLAWLTSFYFDCRYPGDNFIVATAEHEKKALVITENILRFVNQLRANYNNTNSTDLFK